MPNETKKNTDRVARNTPRLLSIDWTKTDGETPFFVPMSGVVEAHYGVAVDTGILKYSDYTAATENFKEKGVSKIFNFYGKESINFDSVLSLATIPGEGAPPEEEALGLYIPIRPTSNIKVLVRIPEIIDATSSPPTLFSDLQDKRFIVPAVYDEIQLNTYGLEKKVNKVARLLESYDKSMIDFEGRVYNADLKKEAERMREIIPILRDLVRTNGYFYSDAQADLIMLGMSGSGVTGLTYLPQYAQLYNPPQDDTDADYRDDRFINLTAGFGQFTGSMFVTSNTMYLYKKLDEISKIASRRPTVHDGTGSAPMGWEQFINTYIKFPLPVIEYTSGRLRSPEPKAQMEKEIKSVNAKSTKDAKTLHEESWRLKSKEFKEEMEAHRKEAKDFVGDTVLGNLNKTINTINSIEDVYNHYLNKLGITYIVKSAVACLNLDLPIDELKSFLLDVNRFAGEVLEILKIPVISLDDMIPTVDIMADLVKQILLSIAEAVKKALIDMVKKVILMYLEACGDPCKLNFGGIPLGEMLSKGKGTEAMLGVVGTMGQNVGGAVLDGMKAGVVSPGLSDQTRKFMTNLKRHVPEDRIKSLSEPFQEPAALAQQAGGQALSQGVSTASEAIKASPIGSLLDTIGNTLTCGEVNKMLKGKATKDSVKIIQSTVNQLCDDPIVGDIYKPLCELLDDEDKINDFFGSLGKVIDEKPIQDQIDNFESITPIIATSLCDADDRFLRCQLLEGKGITSQDVCDAQINASRERAKKRISELSDLLDAENPLQGVVPPVYCTYDEEGNKIEGLVPRDHPSFTFMMRRVLDTTFDGIYSAFSRDVTDIPSSMMIEKQVVGAEVVRVIPNPNGSGEIINPQFKALYDYGYQVPDPVNEPFIQYFPADPADNSDVVDARKDTVVANKPNFLNRTNAGIFPTQLQEVFLPGMSGQDASGKPNGIYTQFQTSLLYKTYFENKEVRDRLNSKQKTLQFVLKNNAEPDMGSPVGGADPKAILLDSIQKAGFSSLSLTDLLGVENYALFYRQFAEEPVEGRENFSVSIQADSEVVWSKGFQNINIPEKAMTVIEEWGLQMSNLTPVNIAGLNNDSFSSVERRFAEFLSNIWNTGENIYVLDEQNQAQLIPRSERPWYMSPLAIGPVGFIDPNDLLERQGQNVNRAANANLESVNSLYNELLRNIQAMCLQQVADSPFLKDPPIMPLLNLAPPPCGGNDPGLLELENIKNELENVYESINCKAPTMPNVSGLGNNKDNALEQSILFGIVRVTARVYAIEAILKTLPTFSSLNIEDVEDVFVSYVQSRAIKELQAKNYLDDFLEQCLQSYNNVHPNPQDQLGDARKAFSWFLSAELKYAVSKILSLTSISSNPDAVSKLLFDATPGAAQTDLDDGHWLPSFWVSGSTERPQRLYDPTAMVMPERYGVQNADDIVGLKDWRNGNIYLEKYIRADYKQVGEPGSLWPIQSPGGPLVPTQLSSDARGACALIEFSSEFDSIFSSIAQAAPPAPSLTSPITISQDECAPEDILIPGTVILPVPATNDDWTLLKGYFKNLRYGFRLVCQVVNDTSDNNFGIPNQPLQAAGHGGYPLTPRNSINKAYHIRETEVRGASTHTIDAYTFPVVCVEKDIPLETPIADIIAGTTSEDFFNDGFAAILPELVREIKDTPEYAFIFDYCFPIKRLVSLAALYNITYTLPFPGINTTLMTTKEHLRTIFNSVSRSGNYQYRDLDWTNKGIGAIAANGGNIPGFDFSKVVIKFLFGLLKGAAEIFDPNIAVAKKIHDAATMIGPLLVNSINKAQEIQGRISGQTDKQIAANQLSECDRVGQLTAGMDIPMLLISMGLMPINIFTPFGIGPPLTPLGIAYLTQFGGVPPFDIGMKTMQALSSDEQSKARCKLKDANGPDLTGKGDCSP